MIDLMWVKVVLTEKTKYNYKDIESYTGSSRSTNISVANPNSFKHKLSRVSVLEHLKHFDSCRAMLISYYFTIKYACTVYVYEVLTQYFIIQP